MLCLTAMLTWRPNDEMSTIAGEFEYSTVVSPNDRMWHTGPQWYFDIGLSAIECIRRPLAAARIAPRSILDLPCGHGRVGRMLRAAYPDARLTVCDLDRDGVEFCAAQFDAEPMYSQEDLRSLRLGRRFDVIWCGSLFTHLDQPQWPDLLSFFVDHLEPGGIVVFTTHGRQPIQWMLTGFCDYGMTPDEQHTLIRGYADAGFGYVWPQNQLLGLSLSSTAFVCRQIEAWPSLKLMCVEEAGWAGHHDVFSCQQLSVPYPSREELLSGSRP
jgi:SAM-dependent methyltransferase